MSETRGRVLIVDDDFQSLGSTSRILALSGHEIRSVQDPLEGVRLLEESPDGFDVLLTDVRMPGISGLELLERAAQLAPGLPVVVMTAHGRVDDAVHAMKHGAVDFLTKPFNRATLLAAMEAAMKRAATRRAPRVGGDSLGLVGSSARMERLRGEIARLARTQATVLVTGESGTGKERVARAIHDGSARRGGPWVAVNCAAIPAALIESELFGHERGAFTGAQSSKPGLIEAASGGTLFLDEIGDMPLPLQASLLRVLQEGEVRRLGSTETRRIDVRIVAATNRRLRDAVVEGRFREDLLFRLEVMTIETPALREHPEDLPELAAHFVNEASLRHAKESVPGFPAEVLARLQAHSWPGNVRELANVIERAVVLCTGAALRIEDLPSHLVPMPAVASAALEPSAGSVFIPAGTSLREAEDLLIRRALETTEGDRAQAARLLGINERTIYRRIRRDADSPQTSQLEPDTPASGDR